MSETLLLIHAAATWFMTGLIWFVQIVHYPLMAQVGVPNWTAYSRLHRVRTTLVVGPVMLIEAATAVALLSPIAAALGAVVRAPALTTSGAVLLAAAWISTSCLQVPAHLRLDGGYDDAVLRRLVRSNWLRTWAWSARGVIAGLLFFP